MDRWNLTIAGEKLSLIVGGPKTGAVLPTEARIAGEQAVEHFNKIGLKIDDAKLDWPGQPIALPHGTVQNTGATPNPGAVREVAENLVSKCRGFGLEIETATLEFNGQTLNVLSGAPAQNAAAGMPR